ncbi:MAG: hypothetical protein ABH878_00205 [bacterium]
MKNKITLLCLAAALSLALTMPLHAVVVPTFEPAQFIYWGSGQVIMTDNYGVIPCVGDWNGDNVKDILVGTYYYGNIYFYPNTGSNQNPVFASRTQVYADGSPIAVTYG